MEIDNNQKLNGRFLGNNKPRSAKNIKNNISKEEVLALKKFIKRNRKAIWNYLQDLEKEKGIKLKA